MTTQLQLFTIEKEPYWVANRRFNLEGATITPEVADGHLHLLGVNYSLDPVEGWVAARHLGVRVGADTHALTDWEKIAWVDPATIALLLATRGLNRQWVTSWGFGPTYKFGTGVLSRELTGKTECVSFILADPRDYDWVKPLVEVAM